MSASRMPWPVRASREVYRNPWLRVHEDRIKRPDGSTGTYGVIEVGDAVSIVALTKNAVCLVRQYRPPWRRKMWEVPCGGIRKGERPLAAAKRELLEEAGITARSWRKPATAGVVRANDPVINTFHVFLARDLRFGAPRRDASESDMVFRMWKWKDFRKAVSSGVITDDMSLACIFKCLLIEGINFDLTPAPSPT
ncbi:MAG: NUDIX hydrolase [Candidatus Edwardsbacteria bacterium]|nr:NUDIX hydrolase [Candidatus Edwardsbacteria bacterium]